MKSRSEILEHLKRDEIDNINIINFIEGYPISHIEMVGSSVFIKGRSDRNWVYISSKSAAELEMIRDKLDEEDKNFAVVEDWMVPILVDEKHIDWKLSAVKMVVANEQVLPEPRHRILELKIEDSAFIYESSDYKEYLSIEYIRERIENGISSCICFEDKLVAWGITQDDGAIGFLHVLPEYRGRGCGRDIMLDMIKKVRDKGKIPFVHIEEDNERSMGLALSLGFIRNKVVNWIGIE